MNNQNPQALPDTPVATPTRPLRKRTCTSCKAVFVTRTDATECQNCTGGHSKVAQELAEAKAILAANSSVTLDKSQMSEHPSTPSKVLSEEEIEASRAELEATNEKLVEAKAELAAIEDAKALASAPVPTTEEKPETKVETKPVSKGNNNNQKK